MKHHQVMNHMIYIKVYQNHHLDHQLILDNLKKVLKKINLMKYLNV